MILIPVTVQDAEKRRFAVAKGYVRSVIDAGGLPVLIPVTVSTEDLRRMFDVCAGVMLTGGADCDPALFGEAPHEQTYGVDADRDRAELHLTRWAAAADKPIFGICRGVQIMNVALSGSLIQDIPSQWESDLSHAWKGERNETAHAVRVESGSRLAAILRSPTVGVNSFHHQSLKRVADGLAVTARADDGIIEAVEMPEHRFALGVQWHPEDLSAERREMQALFDAFVDACRVA